MLMGALKYQAAPARPLSRIPTDAMGLVVKGNTSGSLYNTAQNIQRKQLGPVCFVMSLMFPPPVCVDRPGNMRRLGGPMAGPGGGRGRGMNLLR